MKKVLTLLAVVAFVVASLLSAGCGAPQAVNEETYVLQNPKTGEPLKDDSGKYLTATRKYSNEDSFNKAQVANQQAAKPIAALIAPDDKPLTLSAGARFVVYGENGKPKMVKQYVPESTQNIREIRKGVKDIAPAALVWKGMDTMEAVASKGGPTNYNNSFNNNSGAQAASGSKMAAGISTANASAEGASAGGGTATPTQSETDSSSNGGNSLLSGGAD